MTFSENNDLAAKNPDKLKELQALFMDEARKYQVLPLDNSFLARRMAAAECDRRTHRIHLLRRSIRLARRQHT
jgi:hypothetical protein